MKISPTRGLVSVFSATFGTMKIDKALRMLEEFQRDGHTHARFTSMVYQPKPPKAPRVKPADVVSSEPGVPGRIHLADAKPGKVRRVPT